MKNKIIDKKELYIHFGEGANGEEFPSGRKKFMTQLSADQANNDLLNNTDGGFWVLSDQNSIKND